MWTLAFLADTGAAQSGKKAVYFGEYTITRVVCGEGILGIVSRITRCNLSFAEGQAQHTRDEVKAHATHKRR